ncbi:MAG: AsmA family protein [Candidatus Omnitrophota bacterium]
MRGKTFLYVLLFLAAPCIAAYFLAGPIASSQIENQIKKTLNADSVSIGRTDFSLSRLSLKDIKIKKISRYDLKIENMNIYYTPRSLAVGNHLDKIRGLSLEMSSLSVSGLEARDIILKIARTRDGGFLRVGSVKYNKITLARIRSAAFLENGTLYLNDLVLDFLGGKVKGDASLDLDKGAGYDFKLKALDLDIKTLVNDFKLTEKFEMTGNLGGDASLAGEGIAVTSLDGNFFTGEKGGILRIKDRGFLENIAKRSNQSMDIIVESFKNYHYNKGNIRLFSDRGDVILDVLLDGGAGKRDLTVILHDFILKKGGL